MKGRNSEDGQPGILQSLQELSEVLSEKPHVNKSKEVVSKLRSINALLHESLGRKKEDEEVNESSIETDIDESEYRFPPKARRFETLELDEAKKSGSAIPARKKELKRDRDTSDSLTESASKPVSKRGRKKTSNKQRSRKRKQAPKVEAEEPAYYFKSADNRLRSIELEAYNAAVCKFIAGPEYVSSVNTYFDEEGKYRGVASKAMKGFTPNHLDPLTMEDTEIECIREQHMRMKMIHSAQLALTKMEKIRMAQEKQQSLADRFFNGSTMSGKFARIHELLSMIVDVMPYHSASDNISQLESFMPMLESALDKLPNMTQEERELLTDLHQQCKNYHDARDQFETPDLSIEELDEAEKVARLSGIDLAAMDDHEFVTVVLNDIELNIRASDLKNYAKVKGIATSWTTSYLQLEGDMNNTRFEKTGRMIDFDMTKLNLQNTLNRLSDLDKLSRAKHIGMMKFTQTDVLHFPYLQDMQPYYWPTSNMLIIESFVEGLSILMHELVDNSDRESVQVIRATLHEKIREQLEKYYQVRAETNTTLENAIDYVWHSIESTWAFLSNQDRLSYEASNIEEQILRQARYHFEKYVAQNRREMMSIELELRRELGLDAYHFNEKDNEVARSLAAHPVFEFHKFKTMLKFLLSNSETYESLAKLYVSPDRTDFTPAELADDETRKIVSLWAAIHDMPEFEDFLENHGEYAFKLIREEVEAYSARVMQKLDKHPEATHYQPLLEALDISEMEDEFYEEYLHQERPALRM